MTSDTIKVIRNSIIIFILVINSVFPVTANTEESCLLNEDESVSVYAETSASSTVQTANSLWNVYWQESVIGYSNRHIVFRTNIWSNDPLCFIKGVSGYVVYYDISVGKSVSRNIYNMVYVPSNQYYQDFDSELTFPAGHNIKVTYSYNTSFIGGSAVNGGYRSGVLYFTAG